MQNKESPPGVGPDYIRKLAADLRANAHETEYAEYSLILLKAAKDLEVRAAALESQCGTGPDTSLRGLPAAS